jgi:hypothetical protein
MMGSAVPRAAQPGLRVGIEQQRKVPVCVGSVFHARKMAVGAVGLRHRVADQRTLGRASFLDFLHMSLSCCHDIDLLRYG